MTTLTTPDLSTEYLGLKLAHPLVAGASPMVDHIDQVRRLEDAGVAAIVMHSLFEEQIRAFEDALESYIVSHEENFAEATTYFPRTIDFALGPDQYLAQLQKIKETVDVPVVASLNGLNLGGWIEYATQMESAGADALELNLYQVPTELEDTESQVLENLLEVVSVVRQAVRIPLAVKLSPFFTALPNFARRLQAMGVNGLVLFNRFYQPDIDVENLEMRPRLQLSDPSELGLRLRWLAVLYGRTGLDLALTGGVHSAVDAIKGVMTGAACVQVVSALLKNGPEYVQTLRQDMLHWMEENEFESIEQMRGNMSYLHCPDPSAIERANYLRILQSWRPTEA